MNYRCSFIKKDGTRCLKTLNCNYHINSNLKQLKELENKLGLKSPEGIEQPKDFNQLLPTFEEDVLLCLNEFSKKTTNVDKYESYFYKDDTQYKKALKIIKLHKDITMKIGTLFETIITNIILNQSDKFEFLKRKPPFDLYYKNKQTGKYFLVEVKKSKRTTNYSSHKYLEIEAQKNSNDIVIKVQFTDKTELNYTNGMFILNGKKYLELITPNSKFLDEFDKRLKKIIKSAQ